MTAPAGEESFARPDPARGEFGDARYAARWAEAHSVPMDDPLYRCAYADLLALDALLSEGYALLDVGCGTAGYHRLLARHGRVHGVDANPEMVDAANRFREAFSVRGAEYTCSAFEDFAAAAPYDAVRLCGVYGWYVPWHGRDALLRKAHDMLKPSGFAVLSYVPPRSASGFAKALLAPGRTVVITRRKFLRMVRDAGFMPVFEVELPHTTLLFARAQPYPYRLQAESYP